MPPDVDAMAGVVVQAIKAALSPVLERLAAAEARLSVLGDLRDRVVTIETKSAMPIPVDASLGDLRDRLLAVETKALSPSMIELGLADLRDRLTSIEGRVQDDSLSKELGHLRERVAVVEVRPSLPGPPGEPGLPGQPGKDGQDGTAGLSFEGVYQEGQTYEKGHLVTWAGSSWHCNEPTTSKPGDGSKAWTLMVKRGRDGKDGINGRDLAPVVKVGT